MEDTWKVRLAPDPGLARLVSDFIILHGGLTAQLGPVLPASGLARNTSATLQSCQPFYLMRVDRFKPGQFFMQLDDFSDDNQCRWFDIGAFEFFRHGFQRGH